VLLWHLTQAAAVDAVIAIGVQRYMNSVRFIDELSVK
jgi:hypothetical protein